MADPNQRDPSTTDELVDIISDPIHDLGVGLGPGRDAAHAVLMKLAERANRNKIRVWLDETDREVTLLRSIVAKFHEIGPSERPWGEVIDRGALRRRAGTR